MTTTDEATFTPVGRLALSPETTHKNEHYVTQVVVEVTRDPDSTRPTIDLYAALESTIIRMQPSEALALAALLMAAAAKVGSR